MNTADEIECELTRRFKQVVHPGMTQADYLRALATTTIKLIAELAAPKPCVYEARPLPRHLLPTVAINDGPAGAWCQTHGWDCPRNAVPQPTLDTDGTNG